MRDCSRNCAPKLLKIAENCVIVTKTTSEGRKTMSDFKFALRQKVKMLLQNGVLPLVYCFWCTVYARREKELIVFADAHHDALPFSMERLHRALEEKGYAVTDALCNFSKVSQLSSLLFSLRFMRLYARAKYVFICDNFLPVSACRKDSRTTVVQLWHGCGLIKKMGYDTPDDIPAGYKGEVYRNYDLVSVSTSACVEPLTRAMRQAPGVLQPLGVSRTDYYFDQAWLEECRTEFYRQYPQAAGKTVVLWAPTFRGKAGEPYQVGSDAIDRLERELGEGYFLVRKLHPHVEDHGGGSGCAIPTERLLPVTDLLITDYSTVLTDFMLLDRPYVLFAPDLEEYRQKRGFYVEYSTLSRYIVEEETQLADAVRKALADGDKSWIADCRRFHLSACDGHSTQRILDYLKL